MIHAPVSTHARKRSVRGGLTPHLLGQAQGRVLCPASGQAGPGRSDEQLPLLGSRAQLGRPQRSRQGLHVMHDLDNTDTLDVTEM